MKTHRPRANSGNLVTLYTDDTFTLAIGLERTESTPRDLAEIFSRRTLLALKAKSTDSNERAKLEKAILMFDYING